MSTDRTPRPLVPRPARAAGALLRGACRAVAAVLLLAVAAAPALAQQDADGMTAGERIAEGLRETPVYVDPLFEPALPAERQQELAEEIEETGLPFYVVLVPVVQGDDWDGSPETMLEVVRDRLGVAENEPMVAVTNSESGGVRHLRGHEWPWSPESDGEYAVRAVNLDRSSYNASLHSRLSRVVELTASGEGRAEYERAREELTEGMPDESEAEEGSGGVSFGAVALVVAPLLAVTAGVVVLVARARRGRRYEVPATVFEVARTAGEDELRQRARQELVEFGERLSDHDVPLPDARREASADASRTGRRERRTLRVLRPSADPGQALHRALDAYAAAGTVLDGAREVPDLVGVIALVAEGTAALDGASAPAPGVEPGRLCFFQPLHGPAGPRVRWRQVGRTAALKVPACEQCAAAVRAHRAPEVLTVPRDGRRVPYFDEPAERSVWAASGYGAFGGGTLTERVRRGDFTRTRGR
ncbi:hypothetical protein [Streptomyces spiramenti]|uniref:TPM domain-containing protein n=1 Tax=Streptomyces spiramenti TaxID=2720606 RepID=A0ABX1AQP9_9ACTN|nr:hypothetical protein [Streptomyces spiramenti]NJP68635.1 hypothetical protein [Streptomyces spiramenti]